MGLSLGGLGAAIGGLAGAMVGMPFVGALIGGAVGGGADATKANKAAKRQQAAAQDAQRKALEEARLAEAQKSIGASAEPEVEAEEAGVSAENEATRRRRRFKTSDTVSNNVNLLGGLTGRSVLGG